MEDVIRLITGYLRGMWRYRWWGLALAWVVAVAGAIAVFQMPDRYTSSARVFVDTQSVLRPLMSGLAIQPNIDQRVAILSRTLITRPNVEKLYTMAELDLEIHSEAEREAMISNLMSGLRIGSGRGGDNMFTLSFQDESPERAQRIVQALVSLFVESGLVTSRQSTDEARRFIERQIAAYEARLVDAENRLKEFRLRNMELLGDGNRDFVSQIASLNQQLSQAELELREARNMRDSLERQIVGEEPVLLPPAEPQIARSATPQASVPELDRRIEALERDLDGMLLRYTDQHPDVIGSRRVIESLREQRDREIALIRANTPAAGGQSNRFGALDANPVFQQMRISLSTAEARVSSLEARVEELQTRIATLRERATLLPELEAEQAQLNRDYNVHRRNYEELVSRRESALMTAELGAESGVGDFRVMQAPSLPTTPSAPNRLLLVPLAGLAGLGAGAALTFLLAQLRPTIFDGRTLRNVSGLPVLGTVSFVPDPGVLRAKRLHNVMFAGLMLLFIVAVSGTTMTVQMIQG